MGGVALGGEGTIKTAGTASENSVLAAFKEDQPLEGRDGVFFISLCTPHPLAGTERHLRIVC